MRKVGEIPITRIVSREVDQPLSLADQLLASSCRDPDLGSLMSAALTEHGSIPVSRFVYVITPEGHEVCKVGVAVSVPCRLIELQCGAWAKLSCAAVAAVIEGSAIHIEQRAHRILKRKGVHLIGEWFATDPHVAIEGVIQAARELGHTVMSIGALKAQLLEDNRQRVDALEAARRTELRRKLGIA